MYVMIGARLPVKSCVGTRNTKRAAHTHRNNTNVPRFAQNLKYESLFAFMCTYCCYYDRNAYCWTIFTRLIRSPTTAAAVVYEYNNIMSFVIVEHSSATIEIIYINRIERGSYTGLEIRFFISTPVCDEYIPQNTLTFEINIYS